MRYLVYTDDVPHIPPTEFTENNRFSAALAARPVDWKYTVNHKNATFYFWANLRRFL